MARLELQQKGSTGRVCNEHLRPCRTVILWGFLCMGEEPVRASTATPWALRRNRQAQKKAASFGLAKAALWNFGTWCRGTTHAHAPRATGRAWGHTSGTPKQIIGGVQALCVGGGPVTVSTPPPPYGLTIGGKSLQAGITPSGGSPFKIETPLRHGWHLLWKRIRRFWRWSQRSLQ